MKLSKMKKKQQETLSTGWVIFGVLVIMIWVALFFGPIWAPNVGL